MLGHRQPHLPNLLRNELGHLKGVGSQCSIREEPHLKRWSRPPTAVTGIVSGDTDI